GAPALVMELVDGPTLQDRIAEGALPVEEALSIARQIAEALEYAHERGIIHRDLKPANVKLTSDGQIKLLDFGLAKALDTGREGASTADLTRSPTMTSQGTAMGVILGTAAYMSPEQARGKPVDRRTDVWAFGVLLWEMLTGARLFQGETVTDTLAAVLMREPEWNSLPTALPRAVLRLLHRCLERDPKQRLHDIADARLEIQGAMTDPDLESASPSSPAVQSRRRSIAPWLIAAAAVGIAAWSIWSGRRRPAPEVVRLAVPMPAGMQIEPNLQEQVQVLAISPDGRRIAFQGRAGDHRSLFVRDLASAAPQPLAGTEEAGDVFFSPDGEWVGFSGNGHLKKISVHGGTPVTLATTGGTRGGAWGSGGTIVFAPTVNSGLFRVPAAGGEPRPLTTIDAAHGERTHRWPEILPDGATVLFTVGTQDKPGDYDEARIDAVSLETAKRHTVYQGASQARYAAPGFLILARHGDLLSVPFDAGNALIHGTPVPVLQGAGGDPHSGVAFFGVATTGTLAFVPRSAGERLDEIVWLDRAGRAQPTGIRPGQYTHVAISPDGRRLAYSEGAGFGTRSDNWIFDVARGSALQLTSDGNARGACWSPDSKSIVYSTVGADGFIRRSADGSGPREILWRTPLRVPLTPDSFTADGSAMLLTRYGMPTRSDIFLLPLTGDRTLRPLIQTSLAEEGAALSPDGRWLAYTGEYSGTTAQVYVQPFPSLAGRWQVSTESGVVGSHNMPRWSRDGKELFYFTNNTLMSVPVELSPTFTYGKAQPLFRVENPEVNDWNSIYDVSPDGKRFAFILQKSRATMPSRIDVVLHWTDRLSEKEK
ncbi:MAG: protein kinase, partial [Acidobacteriota bacterium]